MRLKRNKKESSVAVVPQEVVLGDTVAPHRRHGDGTEVLAVKPLQHAHDQLYTNIKKDGLLLRNL